MGHFRCSQAQPKIGSSDTQDLVYATIHNVVRDDFVFADDPMHLVSTGVDFSFSLNPLRCLLTVMIAQTALITGGTGRFATASGTFTGSVEGQGVLPRNPDRSSALDQFPVHEVDKLSGTGTLSF